MKRLLKAVVISSIVGLFTVNLVGCGESENKSDNESDKELKGLLKEKLQNDIENQKRHEEIIKKIDDDQRITTLCLRSIDGGYVEGSRDYKKMKEAQEIIARENIKCNH